MANQQDKQLILQILLEDLEAIQVSKKGKRRADQPSDLEVAISSMREDLQNTQISMHDQVLAHSTSSAILTDQNALMEAKEEEWIANQDHRLAVDLSNGRRTPRRLEAKKKPMPDDNNDDSVSVIMEDLMSRVSLTERSDNGEGSSRSPHAYRPAPRRVICVSCLERCDTILAVGKCGHEYCLDCTRQMFLGSIRDEELYPPRCCGNVIPPGVAMRVLNYLELRDFSERALEWTAKDRVYCADPTCSTFIPAFAIEDELGTCPKCSQRTHLPCRSLIHPGVDCPMDENLPAVLEIAETEGWKRCPRCRTMVELWRGCNHMTCRCGQEFCYVCTAEWKTCTCEIWYEERLVDEANQVVEEQVPQNVAPAVRQRAFDQAVENLLHHEEVGCEHHVNSQWAWRNRGSMQCDVCAHHLPEYIFVCRNCRMRACWRCRRNRLR